MHYNEYPYPDPEFYLREGRRITDYRVNTVPTKDSWDQWYPGQPYRKLRVLVVGCGTCEAIMVAATNPDFEVRGIDQSQDSIDICRGLIDADGVQNCRVFHCGIEDWFDPHPVDIVVATGVLHHFPYPIPPLERIRSLLALDGRLAAMVYGNYLRSFFPGFCSSMTKLGLKADKDGVDCTREIIRALPEHHPVKEFSAAVQDKDCEVADMWLHSYFRQYSASEFISLVESARFSFRLWLREPSTESSVIDSLPPGFQYLKDRFYRLSASDRYDICQVLNHNDLKLTGLFAVR